VQLPQVGDNAFVGWLTDDVGPMTMLAHPVMLLARQMLPREPTVQTRTPAMSSFRLGFFI
jgi:hypothetical protein